MVVFVLGLPGQSVQRSVLSVKWLKKLLLRCFEMKMPVASERDLRLADELRQALRHNAVPLGGAEAADTWVGFSEELCQHMETSDPREFLQCPVVRKSMFVSNPRYIADELRFLRARSDWADRWRPGLRESAVGRPRPYPRFPRSSGNLIHHAYSLARFEAFAGIKAADIGLVYEFGGGYGSMARLFHQMGFAGNYLIQDLPAFSALQRFYLGSLGYYHVDKQPDRLACVSDFPSARLFLDEWKMHAPRLFVATWSLSESPLSVREPVLDAIADFDYVLVAFQQRFESIDNLGYFENWAKELEEHRDCEVIDIEHLPGNSYLFVRRS